MALLSISVLLLLWNYILKYKKEKYNLKGKRQESVYQDIGDSLDTVATVIVSSPTTVTMPPLSSLFIPMD
jgi:predicted nucleotide-binding protein